MLSSLFVGVQLVTDRVAALAGTGRVLAAARHREVGALVQHQFAARLSARLWLVSLDTHLDILTRKAASSVILEYVVTV